MYNPAFYMMQTMLRNSAKKINENKEEKEEDEKVD